MRARTRRLKAADTSRALHCINAAGMGRVSLGCEVRLWYSVRHPDHDVRILPIAEFRGVALRIACYLPPLEVPTVDLRTAAAAVIGALGLTAAAPAQTASVRHASQPLAFERNAGQTDPRVKFLARHQGGIIFLRGAGATLAGKGGALTVRFVGANPKAKPVAGRPLPGKVNYCKGKDPSRWISGLSTHSRVRFVDVYPGIDVVYYGRKAGSGRNAGPDVLEFDCEVRPGADPTRIKLAFDRAESVRIENGDLVARASGMQVRLRRPVSYQTASGARVPVASKWTLEGTRASATARAAFKLARYDRTRTLVVDPVMFLYSTRFGGSSDDRLTAVAEVPGSIYEPIVTVGDTISTDFPTMWPQQTYQAGTDVVVTIWQWNLLTPAFSTYVGGSGDESATCVAMDADRNVFVGGHTTSPDFPTANASQASIGGGQDAFIARVDGISGQVAYSTYYGGSDDETVAGLVTNAASATIAGTTTSADLPGTALGYQSGLAGGSDGFLAAFAPTGQVAAATYFGGSDDDHVTGIANYPPGGLLIGGYGGDGVPMAGLSFQDYRVGGLDGFVAAMTSDLTGLQFSTYLGGSGDDRILAISSDPWGLAVAGDTTSADFPISGAAYQTALQGPSDAFVTRFENGVEWTSISTYLGGSGDESATGVNAGRMIVAGYTTSADFPTVNAFQPVPGGGEDGFITAISSAVAGPDYLLHSSYLGGSGDDRVLGMTVDLWGEVLAVGSTSSPDYPSERVPIMGNTGSGVDGFMTLVAYEHLGTGAYLGWPAGAPGQWVAFVAGINGPKIPLEGRTIEFSVDGVPVGSAVTDYYGDAVLPWLIPDTMPVGMHTLRMDYAGEANYDPVWIEVPFDVQGPTKDTKLYVPSRSATNGRAVYLRGYLLETVGNVPVPGETVAFRVDGSFVGSAVTSATGRATLTYVPQLSEGTWPLEAEFAGSGTHSPSTGSSAIAIQKGDLHLWTFGRSAAPGSVSYLRCLVRRYDDFAPVDGREIRFSVDGTFIGSAWSITSGWAQTEWQIPMGTAPGPHTVTAEFTGDWEYKPASGAGTVNVL